MAERRRAAIHEAGHAVASVALGFSLEKVTIAPDYERLSLGHTSAPDSVWGYGGADTQRPGSGRHRRGLCWPRCRARVLRRSFRL